MKIVIIMCIALFMTACTTVNTVERANPIGQKKYVNDKRIITDSDLDDYAYIASVNESMAGNLLRIQVELVNSSSAYRSINYKFVWFDDNGMELASPSTPWLVVTLEGGEKKNISSIAPNPKAKDFTLKLLPTVR